MASWTRRLLKKAVEPNKQCVGSLAAKRCEGFIASRRCYL
jgi:hypothetical protein